MGNIESSVCRPLARDADALAQAAAAVAAERYDLLEVKRLPEGDPAIEALRRAARDARRLHLVEPDITSPIVDTTGTLEDYRRATKSKWHKNMWRLYRKLVREHDAELRLVEAARRPRGRAARGLRGRVERVEGERGLRDPLPPREPGVLPAARAARSTSAASCARPR